MLVRPSEQTTTHPRFGYSLIVGARYDPSVFPSESWIYIGCISQDPRVKWDTSQFGFSLVRVHALIYELNDDGSLNSNTMISTVDTEASDEAICDLSQGVDTSFIEIPRTFNAAVVSLLSIGSSTQYNRGNREHRAGVTAVREPPHDPAPGGGDIRHGR